MKKLICLSLISMTSLPLLALDVSRCGTRPGVLERLLTDAEKIRVRCIEQVYDENKKQTEKELQELSDLSQTLEKEISKYAYQNNYTMVYCTPRNGERPDPIRSKKCSDLVATKNNVIERMNKLQGWNSNPIPKGEVHNASAEKIFPPCPSKAELDGMQQARYFNRQLYQIWERCVSLAPENYYQ